MSRARSAAPSASHQTSQARACSGIAICPADQRRIVRSSRPSTHSAKRRAERGLAASTALRISSTSVTSITEDRAIDPLLHRDPLDPRVVEPVRTRFLVLALRKVAAQNPLVIEADRGSEIGVVGGFGRRRGRHLNLSGLVSGGIARTRWNIGGVCPHASGVNSGHPALAARKEGT